MGDYADYVIKLKNGESIKEKLQKSISLTQDENEKDKSIYYFNAKECAPNAYQEYENRFGKEDDFVKSLEKCWIRLYDENGNGNPYETYKKNSATYFFKWGENDYKARILSEILKDDILDVNCRFEHYTESNLLYKNGHICNERGQQCRTLDEHYNKAMCKPYSEKSDRYVFRHDNDWVSFLLPKGNFHILDGYRCGAITIPNSITSIPVKIGRNPATKMSLEEFIAMYREGKSQSYQYMHSYIDIQTPLSELRVTEGSVGDNGYSIVNLIREGDLTLTTAVSNYGITLEDSNLCKINICERKTSLQKCMLYNSGSNERTTCFYSGKEIEEMISRNIILPFKYVERDGLVVNLEEIEENHENTEERELF